MLGCTRCVVSPVVVVKKLGISLRQLRVPIAFCQLDGTMAGEGGGLQHFVMELVELQIGNHWETLSFIVAPGMERPLLLGLVWFQKWNSSVNWRNF